MTTTIQPGETPAAANLDAEGSGPVPELRIVSRRIYRGPNYWSYDPAINLLVDLGSLEEWPTDRLPGFTERALALLPELRAHECSRQKPGGFVERLEEGTWAGHVAEHFALALQTRAGFPTRRGKTRGAGQPGQYYVIYNYENEEVAVAAGELAVRLVNHLIRPDESFSPQEGIDELLALAKRVRLGPSTQSIVDEAERRGIPWMRLDHASLIQLGHGVHQRRIRATVSSVTSSIAVDTASDKPLTAKLLAGAGIPVPASRAVRTEEEALAAARRIGFPVVVKPADGNHGRGITLEVRDEETLRQAWERARDQARRGSVLIEEQAEGRDYRLLVIGGRLVAAAERVPAHVVGDGRQTIEQLVAEANADPLRGEGHEAALTRLVIDDHAVGVLARQGLSPTAVPDEGRVARLADTANLSTGGTAIDCTDEVHPDNAALAIEAALVVGLDVAGIDLIAPDLRQPIAETGGAVIEVNAGPGFRMHVSPSVGVPRDVAGPLMEHLFPDGQPSRVPIVSVTGTNGKTTTVRMIAHALRSTGRTVGHTSTDGIYVNDRRVRKADASGPKSARTVLQHPRVDAAVLETARGGILREGLGYDYNDVAVVLNVSADHLGLGGVETVDQLADVKQVVVEAVPKWGTAVLNAEDPRVVRMARACRGNVIYFALEPSEVVDRHCGRGGRALVVECFNDIDMITLKASGRSFPLVPVNALPSTFGGAARMNVQNALATAAACVALGMRLEDLRHGLRTFATSFDSAPGRLNLVEAGGVRVLIDYAHNPAAMRCLGELVDSLVGERPGKPRRIAVIGTAGDRRDEDLREFGATAARHFDEVIVREDSNLRGRAPGQLAALVGQGVQEAADDGARCSVVDPVLHEVDAVQAALSRASDGDIVVLCVEEAKAAWDSVQAFGGKTSRYIPPQGALSSPAVEPAVSIPSASIGEPQSRPPAPLRQS